jgi:hypothetical protein
VLSIRVFHAEEAALEDKVDAWLRNTHVQIYRLMVSSNLIRLLIGNLDSIHNGFWPDLLLWPGL